MPDSSVIRNPYKGLLAFQEADAADFFGRVRLVDRLVEQLADPAPMRGSSRSSARPAPASRRWCEPGCCRPCGPAGCRRRTPGSSRR